VRSNVELALAGHHRQPDYLEFADGALLNATD
jgi:hypothetical protein